MDENGDVAAEYGIRNIPTVLFFSIGVLLVVFLLFILVFVWGGVFSGRLLLFLLQLLAQFVDVYKRQTFSITVYVSGFYANVENIFRLSLQSVKIIL